MKKTLIIATIMILGMVLVVISSCKKSDPIPDYPQLIGAWSGNTSQDGPIYFYIDNIKGTLYITSYNTMIYTSTGYQNFQSANSNGITAVSGKSFHISLGTGSAGPAFIDGIFNLTDMSLSGNFAAYGSGNNVDIITGTYIANKNQ
jgi:hypothetical protein